VEICCSSNLALFTKGPFVEKYLFKELARTTLLTTVPQSKRRYAAVYKTCIAEESKQKLSYPETITTYAKLFHTAASLFLTHHTFRDF